MLTSTAMAAKTKLFGDESTFQVVTDRVKSICFETHTAQIMKLLIMGCIVKVG